MPLWIPKELTVSVEDVLCAQGIDHKAGQSRLASLAEAASLAIAEGSPVLSPAVLYRELPVIAFEHDRIIFDGGASLSGPLIARHLGAAQTIIVLLCSIGPGLESAISDRVETDPLMALGLEGLGSAAVEKLCRLACQHFGERAQTAGLSTCAPLSPGMVGWPVSRGQREIFSLIDGREIGVTLTGSQMMLPRKSLSMAIGVGATLHQSGEPCDHCSLRGTCRHRRRREA